MSPTTILIALVAIALLAALRQTLRSRARGDAGWRLAALVAGQFALAAALWFFLQPPARPGAVATLVVLTADAPRPRAGAGADHVALPEAPDYAGIARVPDLATALRRHPGTHALRVLGAGLPDRDRDVARGLRIDFVPAPLPTGVVAVEAPVRVAAGRRFVVSGRIAGVADARLELLDPAGARIDLQTADREGRFQVSAIAGPAGRVDWTLRRRDAADAVSESIPLPLDVVAGAPLRLVALSGGVNPEQKYFGRWALDAGMALRAQAGTGAGVDIGTAPPRLDVEGLRETDLVVLDDRAWRALGDSGRAALRDAVRDGVGVLLRLTGDPSPADRSALKAWGFLVEAADVARSVELPGTAQADAPAVAASDRPAEATVDTNVDARAPVQLTRRAQAITAVDGAPLLRDASGDVLAVWRAEGRGRVAVWNLADSFRLQLAGRRAAYGSLWGEAVGRLARARGDEAAAPPVHARAGERVVLCGLGDDANLESPDGTTVPLRVDPAAGARACAAAWPQQAGWHRLRDGDRVLAFPVRARDEAPGLARRELRDATLALVAQPAARADKVRAPPVPGPRWPWLLAFLAIAAAVWKIERTSRR